MKINDIQREFLLENFFKNTNQSIWGSVATNLIDTGYCLSDRNPWKGKGGINNFIEILTLPNAVGVVKLKFDLEKFLTSQFFIDKFTIKVEEREKTLKALTEDLKNLKKFEQWTQKLSK